MVLTIPDRVTVSIRHMRTGDADNLLEGIYRRFVAGSDGAWTPSETPPVTVPRPSSGSCDGSSADRAFGDGRARVRRASVGLADPGNPPCLAALHGGRLVSLTSRAPFPVRVGGKRSRLSGIAGMRC